MQITFDLGQEAEQKLEQLMALFANDSFKRQLLGNIGSVLVSEINEGFVSAKDPWGNSWAALKARKGQPLRDTGRLKSSINYQVQQDHVEVGTNVKYAAAHQFGFSRDVAASTKEIHFKFNRNGTVGNRFVKKSKSDFAQSVNVKAHTIVLPARPYLPINQDSEVVMPASWEQSIARNIQNFIEQKL